MDARIGQAIVRAAADEREKKEAVPAASHLP